MKKRVLSVLLSLGLVIGMIPMTAKAETTEEESKKWSDYVAESFESGTGTKDDPYQIATAEQLAKLAVDVNSGVPDDNKYHCGEYFELKNDIDLSGKTWTPIGYGDQAAKPFQGYFDGKGHTVTGLYVDERGNNCFAGLFGVAVASTNETVLKNIIIKDAEVYAGNETNESEAHYGAGVLIGSISINGGSNANYLAIENCKCYGKVDSKMYAGGLIGMSNYGKITNCVADVDVTGSSCSGGFAGYIWGSTISNNQAAGSVMCEGYCGGGFVGYSNSSTFTNNKAAASVVDTGWSAGGFTGADEGSTFEKCIASGNVEAGDWNVGGFGGYLLGKTKITDSVALGDVTGKLTVNKAKAGGFVGTNENSNIKNCYAAGTVTGSNEYAAAGGFVGYDVSGTTESCYYDKTKNSALSAVGAIEKEGSNDIKGKESSELLADVCENYYGGHEYETEWTVDKEASCTEEGSQSHHCKRCENKTDVTVIKKKDHILEKTEAKEATHLTEGNIAYWTCQICKKYFKDEAGSQEITLADTVIAKNTVHTADATGWHTDGTNHWKTCECGEILDKTTHKPDATGWHTDGTNHWRTCECGAILDKAAHTEKTVTTETGTSVTSCAVCGKELSTATIPMVSEIALSQISYTYNGKVKTPAVIVKDSNGTVLQEGTDYEVTYTGNRKSIGQYTVCVTLKGKYTGTKELTFEIVPKGTKLTAKSGQKKAFTVKWKKQKKQISGYQIQYGTKKNFSKAKTVTVKSKNTTKKKITGCAAKKTYYVRIRTYKNVKVNGKTKKIASSWSKTVKVKTK
ncbi:fibronectin type III domain-containing protein [Roseburia sp. BX1005]|uniref:Fibronectin type III domain-containing protein n=1 Tax=Roseburia zhanii TaxID=2763064 RepID=A0A923RVE3_9FIRM|nr:fibronectin type III domain-containing protein [Roseburia zhanii]MBC5714159.1 fibronectin type III domain-containing protein [Roseburia zhanii]